MCWTPPRPAAPASAGTAAARIAGALSRPGAGGGGRLPAALRGRLTCAATSSSGLAVMVTGSKFAGGPAFCGALLLPARLAERLACANRRPRRFGAVFRRARLARQCCVARSPPGSPIPPIWALACAGARPWPRSRPMKPFPPSGARRCWPSSTARSGPGRRRPRPGAGRQRLSVRGARPDPDRARGRRRSAGGLRGADERAGRSAAVPSRPAGRCRAQRWRCGSAPACR